METEDSQKCVRAKRLSSKRDDAVVQPVVGDPVDADRVPVETGAEPIPVPCEPSESENETRADTHPIQNMVHIMRQRQSTM